MSDNKSKYLLWVKAGGYNRIFVVKKPHSYPAYLRMLFGEDIEIKKEPDFQTRGACIDSFESGCAEVLVNDKTIGGKPISYTAKFDIIKTKELY